jgi:hypothetical protein
MSKLVERTMCASGITSNSDVGGIAAERSNVFRCPLKGSPLVPESVSRLEYKPLMSETDIILSCNVSGKGYTQYTYPILPAA